MLDASLYSNSIYGWVKIEEDELEFNFLLKLFVCALSHDDCPSFVSELCLKFLDHNVKAKPELITAGIQKQVSELIESVQLK